MQYGEIGIVTASASDVVYILKRSRLLVATASVPVKRPLYCFRDPLVPQGVSGFSILRSYIYEQDLTESLSLGEYSVLKRLLLSLLLLAGACVSPQTLLSPNRTIIHAAKLWITDSVRTELKKQWNSSDPNQAERKFCVAYDSTTDFEGEVAYTVVEVQAPKKIESATQGSVVARCPRDMKYPGVPHSIHFTDLHTHPPTTCDKNANNSYSNCKLGGGEAWECFPSGADWASLFNDGYNFALIQCSAEAIVPYFRIPFWTTEAQTPLLSHGLIRVGI
jgi:hypothetical protein